MKRTALLVLYEACTLTRHAGACWVINGPIGQRILRWSREP